MRKNCLVPLGYILFATAALFGRQEPLANDNKSGLYVKSLQQVLRLDEQEVDLATAVLIVSERWSDIVQGRRYLEQLDDIAYEIRAGLKDKNLPIDYRAVRVINEYLFYELGLRSVKEATDPNDLFLHSVLDRKRGYCLSLSVLYLCLAERLGLALYGVAVPGHFFVRYDDGHIRFNIETTSKGGYADDEHYIEEFKVPQGKADSIYMVNLNKIQTLGCFLNNLGNSYSDVGNTQQALTVLEMAVEINPLLAEARTNLGNIYLSKGRINDAIYEYRAALEINPDDAKTHNNLGNAYNEKNWLSDAIGHYKHSIRLDVNFVDAYKNLASVYFKKEMYFQAGGILRQGLSIEPRNADLHTRLGNVLSQVNDCQSAKLHYKKALLIEPDTAEAYCGLAVCYNKSGLTREEIRAYQKALVIKPDMVVALMNLGNAYFAQKKYTSAIEQYKKAVAINPDDASIHYNLGAAYSNKGDYKLAEAEYNQAIELDAKMADAHAGLGFVLYKLKKYEQAWQHIKLAEQLGGQVSNDLLEAVKDKLQ
ncbi:MAG: tetratricopeptide repeat protein [Sedimentisphaerales bacterium]|nr:tetratricopeptide repeat protein [Sedimentisphaerales bacterium]